MPPPVNIFFFTGDNAYGLQMELKRWKDSFADKHGSENISVLDGTKQTVSELLDATVTMPFLSEKRLVIVQGLPKYSKQEIKNIIEQVHPQTILVFAESGADKRLTSYKELKDTVDTKLFDALPKAKLIAWMQTFAQERGATLARETADAILSLAGDDQWMLAMEISKLATFANGTITPQMVDTLVLPSGSQVVWKLSDLLGSKRIGDALQYYRLCLERGEDAYGLWAILLSAVRNIIAIWAAVNDGKKDREIAEAAGVHPFSARGLMPLARSLTREQVRLLANIAADSDIALKSGGYRYTVEQPDEVIAVTERMMLACGKNGIIRAEKRRSLSMYLL